MSVELVRTYLKNWDLEDRIREFDVSSATVELAAEAVGCEPARIAKTMSFLVDGKAVLIVLAGDVKIDNRKFKDQFHTKAAMVKPEQLEELVGHPMGGVCPFAVKETVEVYLDDSLKRFETIYPAAGSPRSAGKLNLEELEQASGSKGWIDVSKMRE